MRHNPRNKTFWRSFPESGENFPGSQTIFGGVTKAGKVWLAAYYEDLGVVPKDGTRTLRRLGVFKSRNHAFASVCRKFGELLAKERGTASAVTDVAAVSMATEAVAARKARMAKFLREHPEIKTTILSGRPTETAPSFEQMAGRADAAKRTALSPAETHRLAESIAGHALPRVGSFKVKKGRGGR